MSWHCWCDFVLLLFRWPPGRSSSALSVLPLMDCPWIRHTWWKGTSLCFGNLRLNEHSRILFIYFIFLLFCVCLCVCTHFNWKSLVPLFLSVTKAFLHACVTPTTLHIQYCSLNVCCRTPVHSHQQRIYIFSFSLSVKYS